MRSIAAPVMLVVLALGGGAAAQPNDELLDAPAPPTLPALAHRELTYTFEYTAASIEPNGPGRAYAWFAHNELEYPLEPRKWYAGLASDVAAGSVPGVGTAFLPGNPEIWGRGLWSSVLGLSSGGAVGVVLPVPRSLSARDAEVLKTVRVVRPWDSAYFEDLTLTIRPSYDIRVITGRLIFQLRQGIDLSVILRDLVDGERRTRLTARGTFYAGFRVAKPVGVGLELFEVYQLTAPEVGDGKRAAIAISPSIRFMLGRVQPAISALLPLATPLRGDVESYFGGRLNVSFNWDVNNAPAPASKGEPGS